MGESDRCIMVFKTDCGTVFEVPDNHMNIIMSVEGQFESACSEEQFVVKENDIMIIPPGTTCKVKAGYGRQIVISSGAFFLQDSVLRKLETFFSAPLLINEEYCGESLRTLNRMIIDIFAIYHIPEPMSEVYVYIKLLILLTRIAELRTSSAETAVCANFDKLKVAFEFIEGNYMNDITLEDPAKAAGYSKYHFSRLFRRVSGTTFKDFLNRRRVKESALLLTETNLSVTDVAMKSGFSSITTFNRVFKKIEGCTPSEYKSLCS